MQKKKSIETIDIALSKRELEILRLLQRGQKAKQIAVELNLHEKTISTYKQRMKSKLGVDNDMNDYVLVCTGINKKLIDSENIWYFTFQTGHKHCKSYVKIIGNHSEARDIAYLIFGNAWKDQYSESEFEVFNRDKNLTSLN